MDIKRTGTGRPLVLIGGVGAGMGTWRYVIDGLSADREVVMISLPGQGDSPSFEGETTFDRYADELVALLASEGLSGGDLVGSSLGARAVLELARRGLGRSTVAMDPGGFWSPPQKKIFGTTLAASVLLVRALKPALPVLLSNPAGRTALLAQLSAKPWALDSEFAVSEIQTLAESPGAIPAIKALASGPDQLGAPAGSLPGPCLIVWGKQDRVTLPSQAKRAKELFPDATIEFFDACGHFPHWDQPERTVTTILAATA